MGVSIVFMLFGLIGVVTVGVAVAMTIKSRRNKPSPGPHCGQCGYNLTGATENRCPECGRLFFEAGIVIGGIGPTPGGRRLSVPIVLLVVLVSVLMLAVYRITAVPAPRLTQAQVARQAAQVAAARTQALIALQAADAAAQQTAQAANSNASEADTEP